MPVHHKENHDLQRVLMSDTALLCSLMSHGAGRGASKVLQDTYHANTKPSRPVSAASVHQKMFARTQIMSLGRGKITKLVLDHLRMPQMATKRPYQA